jgi:hypothetical protein
MCILCAISLVRVLKILNAMGSDMSDFKGACYKLLGLLSGVMLTVLVLSFIKVVAVAVVPVGPGVAGGAGVAADGVANGVDALTVAPVTGGATTVIFVVLPVCIDSRASSISELYSLADIPGLLKPNCLFNIFNIYDQLEFIKNTSSGDENDFTISLTERVLFIGTQFSILYTSMYSPAEAATPNFNFISCNIFQIFHEFFMAFCCRAIFKNIFIKC